MVQGIIGTIIGLVAIGYLIAGGYQHIENADHEASTHYMFLAIWCLICAGFTLRY